MVKYRINLTESERSTLKQLVNKGKGKSKASTIQKAHVLLASDESVERQSETVISHFYHLSIKSVERTRKHFAKAAWAFLSPSPAKSAVIKNRWDGRSAPVGH